MSTNVFENYANYYDLLYSDKDYDAEIEYIHKVIRSHISKGNKIIEFGSGTGIHGNKLTDLGYDVEGVELSKNMVNFAQKSNKFNLFQGDMTSYVSSNAGKFDVALSLFHVVSYLHKDSDLNNFFKNAYLHLKENGILIFDIWFSPAVEHTPPELRIKKMKNSDFEIIRIAEPKIHDLEKVVDVNFTIFSKYCDSPKWDMFQETHKMRHFSLSEIENYSDNNNFKIIKKEEFMTSKKLDESVWGACFVLQKQGHNTY